MKTGRRKDRSDRTDKTDRTDLRPKTAGPAHNASRSEAGRRRCWCCGSRNVYPERGAKGVHWWVCDDCGEGC